MREKPQARNVQGDPREWTMFHFLSWVVGPLVFILLSGFITYIRINTYIIVYVVLSGILKTLKGPTY